MNLGILRYLTRSALALGFSAALLPSVARAAVAVPPRPAVAGPHAQTPLAGAQGKWHKVPRGPHTFYGTIAAINGAIISVRLRNGKLRDFDASPVLADGNFSAPLFVGKAVSIDGNRSGSTFVVAHIFRLTTVDSLPSDQ